MIVQSSQMFYYRVEFFLAYGRLVSLVLTWMVKMVHWVCATSVFCKIKENKSIISSSSLVLVCSLSAFDEFS